MALFVLTGGARSGKSSAAERLAAGRGLQTGRDVYVATFARTADDAELAQRVARHREDRVRTFKTVEASDSAGWLASVPDDAILMIDCLGTLLGRVMEECWPDGIGTLADAAPEGLPPGYAAVVESRFEAVVAAILRRAGDTIVVTNEVGAGIVPMWASARLFGDLIGRANRRLVDGACSAYVAVCGRLIDLSSLPDNVSWPDDQECM